MVFRLHRLPRRRIATGPCRPKSCRALQPRRTSQGGFHDLGQFFLAPTWKFEVFGDCCSAYLNGFVSCIDSSYLAIRSDRQLHVLLQINAEFCIALHPNAEESRNVQASHLCTLCIPLCLTLYWIHKILKWILNIETVSFFYANGRQTLHLAVCNRGWRYEVWFTNSKFALPQTATLNEMGVYLRRAEDLGFESATCIDHMLPVPPATIRSWLEPMVLLGALAGVTRTIKLGPMGVTLPFRNPVYYAKEWATLDLMTGGRTIFGIAVDGIQKNMRRWESREMNADVEWMS